MMYSCIGIMLYRMCDHLVVYDDYDDDDDVEFDEKRRRGKEGSQRP